MSRSKKTEIIIPKNKDEKLALAKKAMQEINKSCEEKVIDFANKQKEWTSISTGVKALDEFVGGFWRGHFNVLWGGEGVGKTTLMYHTIAEAQKNGLVCAYLDLEDSFEQERAKTFGVNLEELIIGRYSIAEQALDTIIKLSKNRVVDVIILDSIHSLSPKQEQDNKGEQKSVEKDTMALLARKLSQFFRMACNEVYKANVAVILIGQTRTNLGGFIALQTLSGGAALRHNSILTIHIRRGSKSDAPTKKYKLYFLDPDGKIHHRTKSEVCGFDTVFKINKTQAPDTKSEGTEIHMPFYFESGFQIIDKNVDYRIEGTEEEKQKIRELLGEFSDSITKIAKEMSEESSRENAEKALDGLVRIKKKRGRPKKSLDN